MFLLAVVIICFSKYVISDFKLFSRSKISLGTLLNFVAFEVRIASKRRTDLLFSAIRNASSI